MNPRVNPNRGGKTPVPVLEFIETLRGAFTLKQHFAMKHIFSRYVPQTDLLHLHQRTPGLRSAPFPIFVVQKYLNRIFF